VFVDYEFYLYEIYGSLTILPGAFRDAVVEDDFYIEYVYGGTSDDDGDDTYGPVTIGADAFRNARLDYFEIYDAGHTVIGPNAFQNVSSNDDFYLYYIYGSLTIAEKAFTGSTFNDYFYIYDVYGSNNYDMGDSTYGPVTIGAEAFRGAHIYYL
jgi:acetyltransferase-like isoleucine patch superfamily enzyme